MCVKRQLDLLKILRDTLRGDDLPAWRKSVKRKPVSTSKFYFFDIGVVRFLQGRRGLKMRSPEFGEAFEAYIHHEIKTYCDFNKGGYDLCYWRATSGFEVDFIINGKTAIEVKGKANITRKDFKGLTAIKEEELLKNYILVTLEDTPRKDGIYVSFPGKILLQTCGRMRMYDNIPKRSRRRGQIRSGTPVCVHRTGRSANR